MTVQDISFGDDTSKGSGGNPGIEYKPITSTPPQGSAIDINYGRRAMKTYPITEGELSQLIVIGLLVSVFFSLGLESIRFSLDIYKDLSLNPLLPESTEHWHMVKWACCGAGIALIGIFLLTAALGFGSKIKRIMKETKFDGR